MTNETIGQKVRRARKKAKLSQDKLARLADVAYNTIVKIESGENPNPTVETIKKIANALGVEIGNLI
ncbi:MAG: helix-turn-helix transcriptional regulator [Bacteroidia bacterium]|nr:helix-turn-helix transcriptional regulator [Bacteroidia bacterium]